MAKTRTRYSPEELACVLSHYDLGVIQKVTALGAGRRRVPKAIVDAQKGRFFLKRSPLKRPGDLSRIDLAHAILRYLSKQDFPVGTPIPTRKRVTTYVQEQDSLYELFAFVEGQRHNGSPSQIRDAGRQLGRLHGHLRSFTPKSQPPTESFHDSHAVRRHLKMIGARRSTHEGPGLLSMAEELTLLYNTSSVHVNEQGFDGWPRRIIHGDWHPGNLLFRGDRVVAVVDFDSVRLAPTVVDLANGLLQFSIVAGRPDPADWPDYFDLTRIEQFLTGYGQDQMVDSVQRTSLPDLMIETLIAEAVLPVAATGTFGHLSGGHFLAMILRKARWLDRHRKAVLKTIKTATSASHPES